MNNNKTMLDRLTLLLNRTMILSMKHDVKYKGIYRGMGENKKLVFDLTEKITRMKADNCHPKYENTVIHSTEYINPEDIVSFELDTKTSTEKNAENRRPLQGERETIPPANAQHPPGKPAQPRCAHGWVYHPVHLNRQLVFYPQICQNIPYIYYPVAQPLKPAFHVNIQPMQFGIPNNVHSKPPIQVNNKPLQDHNLPKMQNQNGHEQKLSSPIQLGIPNNVHSKPPIQVNNKPLQDHNLSKMQNQNGHEQKLSSPIQLGIPNNVYSKPPIQVNNKPLQDHNLPKMQNQNEHKQKLSSPIQLGIPNIVHPPSEQPMQINNIPLHDHNLPEMQSQNKHKQQFSSHLLNKNPDNLINQVTNSNYGQKLDISSTILQNYSIVQLMAGLVPGAENLFPKHVPNLQGQSEEEFEIEPTVGVLPVRRPKREPSVNEDKSSFENKINPEKINNVAGGSGNTQDKTKPEVDYLSDPYSLLHSDYFNIGFKSSQVKYTILKQEMRKPSPSSRKVPSSSPHDPDFDQMSSKDFELFMIKSLDEELKSALM